MRSISFLVMVLGLVAVGCRSAPTASLSPDGTHIAKATKVGLVYGPVGTSLDSKPIVKGDVSSPTISPDGNWIAFEATGCVKVMNLPTRRTTTFAGAREPIAWSTDSSRLCTFSDKGALRVYMLRTDQPGKWVNDTPIREYPINITPAALHFAANDAHVLAYDSEEVHLLGDSEHYRKKLSSRVKTASFTPEGHVLAVLEPKEKPEVNPKVGVLQLTSTLKPLSERWWRANPTHTASDWTAPISYQLSADLHSLAMVTVTDRSPVGVLQRYLKTKDEKLESKLRLDMDVLVADLNGKTIYQHSLGKTDVKRPIDPPELLWGPEDRLCMVYSNRTQMLDLKAR